GSGSRLAADDLAEDGAGQAVSPPELARPPPLDPPASRPTAIAQKSGVAPVPADQRVDAHAHPRLEASYHEAAAFGNLHCSAIVSVVSSTAVGRSLDLTGPARTPYFLRMATPARSFKNVIKHPAPEKALPVDAFLREIDDFIEEHNPYSQNKVIPAIGEGKASHAICQRYAKELYYLGLWMTPEFPLLIANAPDTDAFTLDESEHY